MGDSGRNMEGITRSGRVRRRVRIRASLSEIVRPHDHFILGPIVACIGFSEIILTGKVTANKKFASDQTKKNQLVKCSHPLVKWK
jgi:hypothetical protein